MACYLDAFAGVVGCLMCFVWSEWFGFIGGFVGCIWLLCCAWIRFGLGGLLIVCSGFINGVGLCVVLVVYCVLYMVLRVNCCR